MAAALIMRAQIHPSACMPGVLTRLAITCRSLVNSTTIVTKGGASSPFKMADQNSIFTALSPAKSKANPMSMATAITVYNLGASWGFTFREADLHFAPSAIAYADEPARAGHGEHAGCYYSQRDESICVMARKWAEDLGSLFCRLNVPRAVCM